MSFWKDYFTFNKKERNGIIVLLFIILLLVGLKFFVPEYLADNRVYDHSDFQKELQNHQQNTQKGGKTNFSSKKDKRDTSKKDSLFFFNPNQLASEKWKLLGLSDKQINIIHNYEKSGGSFSKKSDLKKMYSISDREYTRLAPYIQLPEVVKEIAKKRNRKNQQKKVTPVYFKFNPNNLPAEKWKKLGLSDKQIKVIHNYERKGGKFRTKEDVKKMYVISDQTFQKLDPYITIPAEEFKSMKSKHLSIELNAADSITLIKVRGIGPAYAKRILKYRKKLGGFIQLSQLNEIYGFTDEIVNNIKPNFTIDRSKVRKINVNTCSFMELISHPYISKNVTISIINYRKSHGNYTDISQIKKSDLVNDKYYSKIAPYITIH